jgi:hypothetical protein
MVSLSLNGSGAHQLVDVSPLHLAVVLVTLLEQHSQHFDRRIKAQSVGSSPALCSGNANAGLKYR